MSVPPLLRHLLALSRAPHALLDVATPAAAALLWWGAFPPLHRILLGLPTAVAGYLAVYAVNDLVDARADRRKMAAGYRDARGYLDAALVRHPLAAGLVSPRAGLLWAGGLAAVSAVGCLLLNPACLLILGMACVLETLYCRLAGVTCLRAVVSGVVKTLGPVAAVLAVDPSPAALPLLTLATWFFLFEIGGQNIPADWTDLVEDRGVGARTIPLSLGERAAGYIGLAAVTGSVAAGVLTTVLLGPRHAPLLAPLIGAAGLALLILPASRLLSRPDRGALFRLFNRASLYPAAVMSVTGAVFLLA